MTIALKLQSGFSFIVKANCFYPQIHIKCSGCYKLSITYQSNEGVTICVIPQVPCSIRCETVDAAVSIFTARRSSPLRPRAPLMCQRQTGGKKLGKNGGGCNVSKRAAGANG